MSLLINDDAEGPWANLNARPKDAYLPATVYSNVRPKAAPIDCRTCAWGGMASCYLSGPLCVRGSEYKARFPLQFWEP